MNSKEISSIEANIKEEIEKTLQSISNYQELTKPIAPIPIAIGSYWRIFRMDADIPFIK